jgi:hypothetical protein
MCLYCSAFQRQAVLHTAESRQSATECGDIYNSLKPQSSEQLVVQRVLFSGMWSRMGLAKLDVSKEYFASIFRKKNLSQGVSCKLTDCSRIFYLEDRGDTFLPKCRSLKDPYSVTCQKTRLFIVTAVKTSNTRTYHSFPTFSRSRI